MAISNWQSNEIKRFNENLTRVIKEFTINNETATNPYLSKYIRAILKSGLDYKVKTDSTGKQIYSIRNTEKNRENIDKLIEAQQEVNPLSVGEIRQQTREKIHQREGKPIESITQSEINEQIEQDIYYHNLDENLSLLYNDYGVDTLSGDYSNLPEELQDTFKTLKSKKLEYITANEYERAKNEAVKELYYKVENIRRQERRKARKNANNWG